MSVHIDRQNYEEFYLDYLEGNLSGEVLAAFEAFLEANPDLMVDEDFDVLLPAEENLDPVIKLALKQAPDLSELSAETLDYFLIARHEGLLTNDQSAQLDHWLEANAQYRNDAKLMQLAKLTPVATDIYTAKAGLKRPVGRIIPLPVWIGTAAAAAGMAFFLLFNDGTAVNPVGSQTQVADNGRPKVESTTTKDPRTTTTTISPSTVTPAENLVASAHTTRNNKPVVHEVQVIDHLAVRPLSEKNSNTLIPLHIEKSEGGNLPTHLNDMAALSTPVSQKPDMANPIVPITNRLSAALNTEVDFRTAKAAKRKGGGFYLKIGKFEVSHRSASR